MKHLLTLLLFISTSLSAETLLQCKLSSKCDSYNNNCVNDSYNLSVVVMPSLHKVKIGNSLIDAEFDSSKVHFNYLQYMGYIDKNQYSIHLFNNDELRYGYCEKGNPAW